MSLEDIYRKIVLDESRNNEHFYEMQDASLSEDGFNPSCGDELRFYLKFKEDDKNIIEEISFTGHGCAISHASASVLCQLCKGKDRKECAEIAKSFVRMIRNTPECLTDEEEDNLGDAMAFSGIANMPARAKCATLSWNTMIKILEGEDYEEAIDDEEDLL